MSVSDVTSNVLTQNELQPWWEVWRGYSLALMLAASLFLSYNFETIGAVTCRPFNATTEFMTGEDIDYVNSVCVTDYNSALYSGTLNVVGTCLLLVVANWWLSSLRVRRALYSIRKADYQLASTKYLPTVIVEIATEPWTYKSMVDSSGSPKNENSSYYYKTQSSQMSNILSIRDAARKIWLRDSGFFVSSGSSMNTMYIVSNVFSLICVSGLVFTTYLLGMRISDLIFTCVDPPAFEGLGYDTFTCVQVVGSQLTSFIVLYYLLGLIQVLISLGALVIGLSKLKCSVIGTVIERTMEDNLFILELSKNSTDFCEATQLLISLDYRELRERIIQSHEQFKVTGDRYFQDLMRALNLSGSGSGFYDSL